MSRTAFEPGVPHWARLIAARIHTERGRRGLTQAAVAGRAGVRTATVWQAENDPSRMRLDTLQKILAALDLGISLLQIEPDSHN